MPNPSTSESKPAILPRRRRRQHVSRALSQRRSRPLAVIFLNRRLETGGPLPLWFKRSLLIARHLSEFGTDVRVLTLARSTGEQWAVRSGLEAAHLRSDAVLRLPRDPQAAFWPGRTKPGEVGDLVAAMVSMALGRVAAPRLVLFDGESQRGATAQHALRQVLRLNPAITVAHLPGASRSHAATLRSALKLANVALVSDSSLRRADLLIGLGAGSLLDAVVALARRFGLERVMLVGAQTGGTIASFRHRSPVLVRAEYRHGMFDHTASVSSFIAVMLLGLIHRWDARDTLRRAQAFTDAIRPCGWRAPDPDLYLVFRRRWKLK